MKVRKLVLKSKVNLGKGLTNIVKPGDKSQSNLVSAVDYNPETGEVVLTCTARCKLTDFVFGQVRFSGVAVEYVVTGDDPSGIGTSPSSPKSRADKTGLIRPEGGVIVTGDGK